MIPHRLLLKTALALQQAYQTLYAPRTNLIHLPHERWHTIQAWQRKLVRAQTRNYSAAAQQSRQQLLQITKLLQTDLHAIECELEQRCQTKPVPTLRLLYEELRGLSDEFVTMELKPKQKQILAQTESIVLKDIDLGPFQICLNFGQLRNQQPYEIIALQPQYPSSQGNTTHPHVQDEALCEGEGKHAIQSALEQGRIGDAYVLIRQVLNTYNPDSAYVDLESWNGVPCHDCGDVIDEGESYGCEQCTHRLCDDCSSLCGGCHVTLCHGCSATCSGCEDTFCNSCLSLCQDCDEWFCSGCLTNSICETCEHSKEPHAEPQDASPDPQTTPPLPTQTETVSSQTPLQPVCLGEAAVPA